MTGSGFEPTADDLTARVATWLRPALVVCVLAPVAIATAWVVTQWQIDGDENCKSAGTHASCGLTAGGAAAVVAVSAVLAALAALGVSAVGRRSSWHWLGWAVVVLWVIAAAVYIALPPSG